MKDDNYIGPLLIPEFFLIWFMAYQFFRGGVVISESIAFNREWNFTVFQGLVLGFFVAIAFLVIMFLPIIGLIMRILLSLLYTKELCAAIPFSCWVNGSLLWLIPIYIIVFLLIFCLHGIYESDFDFVNFDFINIDFIGAIRRIKFILSAKKQQKQTKSQPAQAARAAEYAREKRQQEAYKKQQEQEAYRKQQEQEAYRKQQEQEAYRKQQEQEAYRKQQKHQQRTEPHPSNLDEALFNGCNDAESLKHRYRQLMKTFHPDNPNGSSEMTQRIQNTYDKLSTKYQNR